MWISRFNTRTEREAGITLHEEILARLSGHRALLSVATDRHIDQSWIDSAKGLVIDPQALHYTRSEVLEYHVRGFCQRIHGVKPLPPFEVDSDGALVSV